MDSYVYGIAAQGNCPALLPAACYTADGKAVIAWDRSGCEPLSEAFERFHAGSARSSAASMLRLAVALFAAADCAWDWLIPPAYLDNDPCNIWYNAERRQIQFCIKEGICGADLITADASGLFEAAELIAADHSPAALSCLETIKKEAARRHLSLRQIIKQLGTYICD